VRRGIGRVTAGVIDVKGVKKALGRRSGITDRYRHITLREEIC